MNGNLRDFFALQDVCRGPGDEGSPFKAVAPTRFYALSSALLVAAGTYLLAVIFSSVAASVFDLRTAELIVQVNFVAFWVVTLAILIAPFFHLQRYRVKVQGRVGRLFHYQEAMVILAGMLFLNIPLMFLAHALSLYESLGHFTALGDEARRYLSSAMPFYALPTIKDVVVCAGFGGVLLVIKGWVFKRVAKRFIQDKRFRAARG
ncbi:hypothetical protein [Motiliproteus sp. SC1-56]|uniref:hypothetical protein n=1 Tax=Motiliproteus sp. SC1-56 TaxID=2799565 RepID=UPI001A8C9ED5|nr:hypothetical protein [Motiliproteus sp. SC1-56]